tara:strand:+ start:3611 stop:5524 length:1914 start_codon:yes stop_codon:yes gene_type:complete
MTKRIFIFLIIVSIPFFVFIKSSSIFPAEKYQNLEFKVTDGLKIGNTIIGFKDNFIIKISATGYKDGFYNFTHSSGSNIFYLEPAGTKLILKIKNKNISNLKIELNNSIVSLADDIELDQGDYKLSFDSESHMYKEYFFNLIGNEESLTLDIDLEKINKKVFIDTVPPELRIKYKNTFYPGSSSEFNLQEKNNTFDIYNENEFITSFQYVANSNNNENLIYDLNPFRKISIETQPENSNVYNNKEYVGQTPVDFFTSQKLITLSLSKTGYLDFTEEILPKIGLNKLIINLEKSFGNVKFKTNKVAKLYINDKYVGDTPQQLRIQTLEQKFSLKRDGHRTVKGKFLPNKDYPLLIDKRLLTEKEAVLLESPLKKKNSLGLELILVEPAKIKLGSPNSEFRRNRNEIQKIVEISKHFYVSNNLITEKIYNLSKKINGGQEKIPVSNLSWTEAAIFCNWLSNQEGFKPFYNFSKNNEIISYDLDSKGYRLLTESEWELIAKGKDLQNPLIYPWGNKEIITAKYGNFADESLRGEISYILEGYDDGFKGKSPVGSFKKSSLGFYDLGGNLSEWVNDFYSEDISIEDNILKKDYIGPKFGLNRVIKGSNFKSATYDELGFSYRAKGTSASELVGFRISRWIY